MTERDRVDVLLAEARGDHAALLVALATADASIRALALGGLHRLGRLDPGQVGASLRDPDPSVRCRALELAIGRPSIDIVPLLDDSDDLVVETAAWALGERESGSPDVVEALSRTATGHEVSICREAAVAALGAIGSPAGLPAILAGLDDRAPVRRRSVLALAPFDTPEVREALERALDDRDRQVRQAAEDLLGQWPKRG